MVLGKSLLCFVRSLSTDLNFLYPSDGFQLLLFLPFETLSFVGEQGLDRLGFKRRVLGWVGGFST